MSKENYIEKKKKNQYHHLNRDQRAQIEILVNEVDKNGKRVYSNADIAQKIGVNRTTIWRELKNRIKSKIIIRSGKIKNTPYNVNDAQYDADYKRAFSKAVYLIEQYPKLAKFIENKIKIDKWAPDVIAGYIESHQLYLQDGFTSISTTTIYRAIHYHLGKHGDRSKTLCYSMQDPCIIHSSFQGVNLIYLCLSCGLLIAYSVYVYIHDLHVRTIHSIHVYIHQSCCKMILMNVMNTIQVTPIVGSYKYRSSGNGRR